MQTLQQLINGIMLGGVLAFVAVAFFAWLLAGGRRRADEKYAGLRSLR